VRRETISAYLRGAGVEIWPPGRWRSESKAKPAIEVITGSDAAKPAIPGFAGALNFLQQFREAIAENGYGFVIHDHTPPTLWNRSA
jgi:hypothetical protein